MKKILAVAMLALAPDLAAAQQSPELSFGGALTSDYIFRGTTQSGGEPALQGYAEASVGAFYLGAWGSTVDLEGDQAELDIYAGYRGEIGSLAYDLGYVRYFYDDSGNCCGEAYVSLDYAVDGLGTIGSSVLHDLSFDTSWAEIRAGREIGDVWAIDAAIGSDFGTLDLGDDKVAWTVGVTRAISELAGLDLRYHDSNYDPGRIVATIALDF